MSDLVSPNGSPLRGGKLLSSRQLTISADPVTHARLIDLAQANHVSIHEAARQLLFQVVAEAHLGLRRQKFIYLIANWLTWDSATLPT